MAGLFDKDAAPLPPGSVEVCFELYQETAAKHGWRTHRYITESFRKSIKARLGEAGGLEAWREALTIAAGSDYLCGRVADARGKRFRMSLNFMLQPASFEKILTGFYTREPEPPPRVYTPTPYQPPHLRPTEPFVAEHPDVRDAALIVSWRKAGRYDKANEVEERLAARQGRPAVLVPAPDVAHMTSTTAPARPPAPSAADEEQARRRAFEKAHEPPAYTDIPEGDYEIEGPE